MACIEITEADFDDLHHALGRPDLETLLEGENYRNFYATEEDSPWAQRAEMLGLWDRIPRRGSRLVTYRVNGDGKSALADWLTLRALADAGAEGDVTATGGDEGPGKTSSKDTPQ